MLKAEAQHSQQNQPAVRQQKGDALESPQSERIAQLEAMAETSPQADKLAQLAAAVNNSPQALAQRRMMDMIHNSSYVTVQREKAEDVLQHKVVQRASFSQGLTRESVAMPGGVGYIGKDTPVGIGNQVNVYEKVIAKTGARLDALNAAASFQAQVGSTLDSYFAKIGGTSFTSNARNYQVPETKSMDPFIFRASTSYGSGEGMGTSLKLDYQNSHRFTGYVIRIADGATGKSSTMHEGRSVASGVTTGIPGTFSNIHADTDTATLANEITPSVGSTEKENEESLDAVTKIAGEGARWVAVRNHATKLSDRSFFVTRTDKEKDPAAKGVSFKNLWLSWKSAFGKAYNIPDSTFVDTLKNKGGTFNMSPWTGKMSGVTADDYDLDNSRSYTP